jgi:hypothetical protein
MKASQLPIVGGLETLFRNEVENGNDSSSSGSSSVVLLATGPGPAVVAGHYPFTVLESLNPSTTFHPKTPPLHKNSFPPPVARSPEVPLPNSRFRQLVS